MALPGGARLTKVYRHEKISLSLSEVSLSPAFPLLLESHLFSILLHLFTLSLALTLTPTPAPGDTQKGRGLREGEGERAGLWRQKCEGVSSLEMDTPERNQIAAPISKFEVICVRPSENLEYPFWFCRQFPLFFFFSFFGGGSSWFWQFLDLLKLGCGVSTRSLLGLHVLHFCPIWVVDLNFERGILFFELIVVLSASLKFLRRIRGF